MPMKMGWRWYGEGNDPITLNDIKQIPGGDLSNQQKNSGVKDLHFCIA